MSRMSPRPAAFCGARWGLNNGTESYRQRAIRRQNGLGQAGAVYAYAFMDRMFSIGVYQQVIRRGHQYSGAATT